MTAFRVAFTGGGTGGHVYPALSIDDAIRAQYDAAHYEPRFFGSSDGIEARVVTGMPLAFVRSAALQRKLSLDTLATLWRNLQGIVDAARALLEFRPILVVATGGYVCFPVVAAAWLLRLLGRLPCAIALLELNVRPGLTNRLLAPLVDEVWTSYDVSGRYFGAKAVMTGTPVRGSLAVPIHAHRARMALGLAPERTTIVAVGGSQGARSINEAVAALVTRRTIGEDRQLLHLCGERDYAYMAAEERDVGTNHVMLVAYVPDPANVYAAADIVVARAGASTLAELAATGTPAVLVPYPYAAEDHQAHNATLFADRGAAVVVADGDVNGDHLWWILDGLLRSDRLSAMRKAARSLAVPDAGAHIVRRIEALITSHLRTGPQGARVVDDRGPNEIARDQP
jgi:UDP-N-acetylglucosamine--N-acetylmuramyl-(pentapeptide) pyrophosphoryl-undecaprenol N-acetylglucosamine transferase